MEEKLPIMRPQMEAESLRIEFTDREITAWGGLSLLKQLLDRTGILGILASLPLPVQGSNRGYPPLQLLVHFWVALWCGASRFEHLEQVRHDTVLATLFGWTRRAGHKAVIRYLKKFTQAINQAVFPELYRWFFHQLQFDNFTVDLDSTVMTRYGAQQGAAKGYNPSKRGRKSHHPLMAFVAESRMVANFWLRAGNTGAANNVFAFLSETLAQLEGKVIGLLRADSGFHDRKIFEWLERRAQPISYIIAMRFQAPIQRLLAGHTPWLQIDEGLEVADASYQANDWPEARRVVIVRQRIEARPKATGKQLRLFADDVLYSRYRYSCMVTNLSLPAHQVWVLYRGRSDAENRIKELKHDFSAGAFNHDEFFATEATLQFVMMAYNLMSLFRQAVLREQRQATMKTLRYQVLAIGAYITRDGRKKVLNLALAKDYREWFRGLWSIGETFKLPHPAPG
jgi:hypothetical protein